MKKFLLPIIAISASLVMVCCSKSDDNNNFDPLPELPDPTDVCSAMDDPEFVKFCIGKFDTNKDGKISIKEARRVKTINCNELSIASFKGIEYFGNLKAFSCSGNLAITTIDLSHNKQISEILTEAFFDCENLQSITLPVGVKSIYANAFSCCSNLTTINIPEGVTAISDKTFFNCVKLTNITIPENVKSIGKWALSCCSALTSITIPAGVVSIGEGAFKYSETLSSIYCKPTTPPVLGGESGVFETFDKIAPDAKIYVPRESVEAYKTADVWTNYAAMITGYDF